MFELLERSRELGLLRAIGLTRLPVMRGMIDDVVALVAELRQIFPAESAT